MDSFGIGSKMSVSALKNFDDITPRIQSHLVKVYSSLSGMLLAATLGVMTHVAFNIGGLLTTLGVFGLILMVHVTPSQNNVEKRLAMLGLLGFLEGACIGPLVDLAVQIDPSIISTAVAGSVCVFACFSASALLLKRRSMLYMGGFLMSALSCLVWMGFLNLLFGSIFLFNLNLYGGLLLFCGFIIFDTQLIVERADSGDDDFVLHALSLFLDFVNVFVRIVVILMKSAKKKE